jgi:topoisomerase-4 subunit A
MDVAETHGDDRRCPITERAAARALDQTELIPTEPVTVVLSRKGWIRAAKGHDVEADKLAYRAGDEFLHAVHGKTNETVLAIDATGRTYAMAAHSLPSARGMGEPLSSQFNPPAGATFSGLMSGPAEQQYLLATDAGYGFVVTLGEVTTRNKAGKACLNTGGAGVLLPAAVFEYEDDWVACVSDSGRLLIFPVAELPRLARGKGVKMMNIPTKRYKQGEEKMIAFVVFREGQGFLVHAGKRYLNMKPSDYADYVGERAQRGRVLPRGFKNPNRIALV